MKLFYRRNRVSFINSILLSVLFIVPSISLAAKCKVNGQWHPYDSPMCKPDYSTVEQVPIEADATSSECQKANKLYERANATYDALSRHERTDEMGFVLMSLAYDADKKCGDL